MAKQYLQFEKDICVGWVLGTDRPGDTSSTKYQLDQWAAEDKKRVVIALDQPLQVEAKFITLKGGRPAIMNDIEKAAVVSAEKQKEGQAGQARAITYASLKQKLFDLGLTEAEVALLVRL